jgi:hypothetical protein
MKQQIKHFLTGALVAVALLCTAAVTGRHYLLNSLVITPTPGASQSTNAFRLYSANGSNWIGLDTNCNLVFFTPTGLRTGLSGAFVLSGSTNRLQSGVLVATNHVAQ